jgi:RNA polymerase sigma-70 factor (ECF subfamily)
MFRIVKNVFLDHYKSRRQKERKLEQPLDSTSERDIGGTSESDPEQKLLQSEQRQALWAALQRVPEAYRTVLVLADMQGLSYEEVAAIVSAPVGTVKSRLNRGRDALRELLLSQQQADPPGHRSREKEKS